jgi:predicted PurR-regulated permease PerM
VIQPLFYKRAVQVPPAVAVVVVLAGAQLAGILGALLAIPTAAALGAVYDELWPAPEDASAGEAEGGPLPAASAP